RAVRPQTVGGMATPFGVYLTTGTIGAGAKGWALVATGVVMALMFCVIGGIALHVDNAILAHYIKELNDAHVKKAIADVKIDNFSHLVESISQVVTFLAFLIIFRLLPLSGIHAAEHKVVHAIERGEELTRENVRRMPRVHPRCGTNLVVGLSLLTG